MDEEYVCDRCDREIPWEAVGYLGPIDRDDVSCSPWLPMEVVCRDCEGGCDVEE